MAPGEPYRPAEQFPLHAAADKPVASPYVPAGQGNCVALEVPAGTGTGFLWDTAGHVVTNYHVVDSGRAQGRYSVTLHSQKTYDAELLGGDPNKDIAVLRLINCDEPLTPLPVLPLPDELWEITVKEENEARLRAWCADHSATSSKTSPDAPP